MRLLFAFWVFAASAIVLQAQLREPPAPPIDPIIGEWHWFNNLVIKMTEDGHCVCPSIGGTWEFSNNKELERKYVIKWDRDLLIDYVTLSRDGKRLTGKSAMGGRVSAEKVERAAAAPATPIPAPLPMGGGKLPTMQGSFYVSVDDEATIYVNGSNFYTAPINESHSPQIELKATDRVVVHLRNVLSGHRFMLVFVSADQANLISFRAHDFKIVPELDVTDFKPEQWSRWNKQPKQERMRNILPIKNYSEWFWGDREDSTVACIITPQMFSQKPK